MQPLLFNASDLTQMVNQFMLPFVRISAMISMSPIIGGRLVPIKIKIVIALLVTLMIAPGLQNIPQFDPMSHAAVLAIGSQILIGMILGFTLQIIFNAISMAGEHIAMTMGLGFAQIVDPQNGIQVPVVSQFLVVIATLFFFSLDGHISIIALVNSSFQGLPVSLEFVSQDELFTLLLWSGKMFSYAVMVALPAVISLLIVNLTMGIMTRSAPQLNIFSVGFPVAILIGFGILFLMLPGLYQQFSLLMNESFDFMQDFIFRKK